MALWKSFGLKAAVRGMLALAIAVAVQPPKPAEAQYMASVRVSVFNGQGSAVVSPGTQLRITSNAPPAGMVFDSWYFYGGMVADPKAPSTTFIIQPGHANAYAVARFTSGTPGTPVTPPGTPAKVALTVTNGTGSGSYAPGSDVAITANAVAGATFVRWNATGATVANPIAASTTVKLGSTAATVSAIFSTAPPPNPTPTPTPTPQPPAVLGGLVNVTVMNGYGSGRVRSGTRINIAATVPPAGMVFDRWAGQTTGIADLNAPTTALTVQPSNTTILAVFRPAGQSTDVTVTVTGGTGGGKFKPGATITLAANAAPAGQVFDKWTGMTAGIADVTAASTTMVVPATNATIAASYKQAPAADVTITVTGGTGGGKFKAGATITLTANAAPAGQVFDKWTGMTTGIANVNAASTTMVVPATNATVTATYKQAPAADVTVSVTGGTGGGKFKPGSIVTVTANAAPAGQVFDKWTGMTTGLANVNAASTTLTVPATNVTIAASYKQAPAADVTITVTSGTGGGKFQPGATITLTANAAPAGQVFDKWTGMTTGIANVNAASTTMVVPAANATVTATYKAAPVTSNDVSVSSHSVGDKLKITGETIFGNVTTPADVQSLAVTLSTNGRKQTLNVDATSGRFAFRVFEGEVADGQPVTLTFERTPKTGAVTQSTFALSGGPKPATLEMVAGRLTFGATPALLNEMRSTGFETWVNRQLTPAQINDSAFMAMNPDNILRVADEPWQLRWSIPNWQMAYAAYSQRQLQEVMTVFWNNHFWSIDTDWQAHMSDINEIKGFRQHALGRFRDLLEVSAKSPQMMIYLDNVFSRKNGINMNYARELLELHTVGVNGGYSNQDIITVAKIVTGWNVKKTSADNVNPVTFVFEFKANEHDEQPHTVQFLNRTFSGTGMAKGNELLDVLAMHPKTQEFVCGKLVELLAADSRPQALIDKCMAAWARSGGVIAESLRAIILDPSYLTSVNYHRTKAKTPYEYATAFVRNFGIYPVAGKEREFYEALQSVVKDAGMDMVEFGVPTGFREDGAAWTNTASMINKLRAVTTQVTWYTSQGSGNSRRGMVNYTQLVRDAQMTTAQAAAAYLLAITTSDRYRKDEYDKVVAALNGTDAFDINRTDAEQRLRKAVGLIVTLPSYQLQ